ncbi:glycosyltransferase family 4 protein [Steroidobacter flavus]|uniref:Glycosyltransferase family 4 protein n=1 Tax=Steroidobacter flavus TaxID=1842136 RepID=A0ABV8T2I8_9GAMM
MRAELWWSIVALAGLVSYALTGWTRTAALKRGVLDIPNERSSHVVPTPRGGGVAIVIAMTAGLVALAVLKVIGIDLLLALGGGGIAIAIVGYLDDRHRLSARVRLAVHFAAALWALAWLGGLPPLRFGELTFSFGWVGYVLGALGIVWTLNLFNFMDGIDGIAASEAIFIVSAGAGLGMLTNVSGEALAPAMLMAAACGGFLLWNWPPARIFMGDAGSGYLGYAVVVLALSAARHSEVALLVWTILGGLFFVDATVTLARRLARGERPYEAHRSHAYQWLSRRWESHKRVTLFCIGLNLLWLLPCAWYAALRPALAGWMVLVALVPMILGALWAGAGRREQRAG